MKFNVLSTNRQVKLVESILVQYERKEISQLSHKWMSPGQVLLGTRISGGCLAPHHPVSYELHVPWQTSWRMLTVVSLLRQISSFSLLLEHHQVTPEHLALWGAGWWMFVEVSFLRWISILSSPYITRLHPGISLFGRPPGGNYLLVDVRGGVFP